MGILQYHRRHGNISTRWSSLNIVLYRTYITHTLFDNQLQPTTSKPFPRKTRGEIWFEYSGNRPVMRLHVQSCLVPGMSFLTQPVSEKQLPGVCNYRRPWSGCIISYIMSPETSSVVFRCCCRCCCRCLTAIFFLLAKKLYRIDTPWLSIVTSNPYLSFMMSNSCCRVMSAPSSSRLSHADHFHSYENEDES